MKQILIVALSVVTTSAFSQGKTLTEVSSVKPKIGQARAFETSWKAHVAQFHGKDNPRMVYEVTSGPNSGSYHLVHGPISFADMDKTRSNQSAHDMDYEKNVAPKLEWEGGNYIYSWRDSLSFNSNLESEKYLVSVTRVKNGKMSDFLDEVRRGIKVGESRKLPFGSNGYVQMFSGTNPTYISIRSLKDGYKELEDNYNNMPPTAFKDAYIKDYSQEQWDKRSKLIVDDVVSREVYFIKTRKDLSSK